MTDAVELGPFDEGAYYQDPLGFFARLRESRPVAAVPPDGLLWRPVSLMNSLESLPVRLA